MDRLWILIAFLLIAGFVFFGISGYCYHALADFYQIFHEYGVPEKNFLRNSEAASMIFRLKVEVITYGIVGILAWAVAVFSALVLRKRKSQMR